MTVTPKPNERRLAELAIVPRYVATALLVCVGLLAVTGTVANIFIYQIAPHPEHKLARLVRRLDLGHEPSIPAWYSSMALLASAFLLSLIAAAYRQTGTTRARHWICLALIFVMLALDEAVMFHELLHNTMSERLHPTGIFYFPWIILGSAFVALVGLAYLDFLRNLDPRTRWLFVAAGATFVGGAIGMEMVAGVVVEQHGVASINHTVVQTIEETLEMLGVVLFIYALLDHLQRHFGVVTFRITSHPQPAAETTNPLLVPKLTRAGQRSESQ